jgi:choline dehydrogenase-like flavoprotein
MGESIPDAKKFVALSDTLDRFGDPFAHVQYVASDFDHETYTYATGLFDRIARVLGARSSEFAAQPGYGSGAHHMGTCSMGDDPAESVVNSFGAIHGCRNIFLAGGSIFPGGNGAVNPTLTMLALALRTADYVVDTFGPARS